MASYGSNFVRFRTINTSRNPANASESDIHKHSQRKLHPSTPQAALMKSRLAEMKRKLEPTNPLNTYGFLGPRCTSYSQGGYGNESIYGRKPGTGIGRLPPDVAPATSLGTPLTCLRDHQGAYPNEAILPQESVFTAGYFSSSMFDVFRLLEKRGGSYNYLACLNDNWIFWPLRDGKFCYELDVKDKVVLGIPNPATPKQDPRLEAQYDKVFELYIDADMYAP